MSEQNLELLDKKLFVEDESYLFSIKNILAFQLLWYSINFLVFSSQKYLSFNLPVLNNIYILIFKFIGSCLFIAFLLFWSTIKYNLTFCELGINLKGIFKNIYLAVNLGVFIALSSVIINITIQTDKIHPLCNIKSAKDFKESFIYLLLIFLIYLVPAFSKELFYRGFIHYYFRNRYSAIVSVIFSILYYSLSYLDLRPSSILIHILMGIITTYLYEKTDSLIAPTVFQSIYHSSLSLYMFSFDQWPF